MPIYGPENAVLSPIYSNLGICYYFKGEYDKSIWYHNKSLSTRLATFGPESQNVVDSYLNLGSLYYSLKKYDKSIDFYQKALDIQFKRSDSTHLKIAILYNDLGNSLGYKREYDKAIECHTNALKIFINSLGEVNPQVSEAYNNLGNTLNLMGENRKAIETYKKSLYSCGYRFGDYSQVNDLALLCRNFIAISSTFQMLYSESHDPQDIESASNYSQQALDAYQYQQNALDEEGTKAFWQSKNYGAYEVAIKNNLLKFEIEPNLEFKQAAYIIMEKGKSALLQAQIKEANAIAFSGIPDSLLEYEHNLRIEMGWREKQRHGLLGAGRTETDTSVLRISGILFDLRRNYEALKLRLEHDYPDYYRLKYDLTTVSLPFVQNTLLSPQQTLLEYFVGDSSLFTFVIRPDTFVVTQTRLDFPLDSLVSGLREGLSRYHTTPVEERSDELYGEMAQLYTEKAALLYQKLLEPIAPLLTEQLIIAPEGVLGYVPFEVLLTEKPAPADLAKFKNYPYVLNQHQISYCYSATLLQEMRERKFHKTPSKQFLAVAPYYSGDTTYLSNLYAYTSNVRKTLDSLPYTGEEVYRARKIMGGDVLTGKEATEERFTAVAGDYRIIHLATHGQANDQSGDYSFLAFSEIPDSVENELLYVRDLYNLSLNADLVVLSACETGVGQLQRGEGIISLARAFSYAGARSILTSMWAVNDARTKDLMIAFYKNLKKEYSKDDALRRAKNDMLSSAKTQEQAHPFYWGGFIGIGDMRPVYKK